MRRVVLAITILVSLLGVRAGSARATVSCDGTLQCAGKDDKGNCVGGASVPVSPEQCKSGVAACSNFCGDGCPAISGNCEAIGGACVPRLVLFQRGDVNLFPRHFILAFIEAEALEDVGKQLHDHFAGEAHLFVGVGMVAFEGERFLHGLVNDDG